MAAAPPPRAMILAAGRGERMRPLTDAQPKPLLTAGGRPLIVWHLLRLAAVGIRDIVVNHAWLGGQIEAALGDGRVYGVRIRYSAEGTALETAGGIARALPLLTDGRTDDAPFLVVSGDTWSDFDYGRARTIALQLVTAGGDAWCVMVPNPAHHGRGDFALDGGRLLRSRPGDATGAALTYAGIGLFRPSLFAAIPPGGASPLRPWLEQAIDARRACGEYHPGRWYDIGTLERLGALRRLLGTDPATDEPHSLAGPAAPGPPPTPPRSMRVDAPE